jgi:hypothetical protein
MHGISNITRRTRWIFTNVEGRTPIYDSDSKKIIHLYWGKGRTASEIANIMNKDDVMVRSFLVYLSQGYFESNKLDPIFYYQDLSERVVKHAQKTNQMGYGDKKKARTRTT